MIGDFHSLDSGSSPDIGISPLFQKWSKIQIVIWFNLSIVKKVEDTAQGAIVCVVQRPEHFAVNKKVAGSIPVANVGWRKQLMEQIFRCRGFLL